MSDLVLDASLTLQWFLEDEAGREYSLGILASRSTKRAGVPILWFYEVGNGLLMAHRRKRITLDKVDGFLTRLKALPIDATEQVPSEILDLPALAQKHSLTNYDAGIPGACHAPQLTLGDNRRPSEKSRGRSGRRDGGWVGRGILSQGTRKVWAPAELVASAFMCEMSIMGHGKST